MKLWITPAEALEPTGYKNLNALYRDLHLNQFPFPYVKIGKRYRISARAIGLVIDTQSTDKKEAAQAGEVVLQATTPTRA